MGHEPEGRACLCNACENINDLISRNGVTGDIGLLSVDIDGNDLLGARGD